MLVAVEGGWGWMCESVKVWMGVSGVLGGGAVTVSMHVCNNNNNIYGAPSRNSPERLQRQ